MPYARTSERAERRALREKMRALGLSHRQIAFEFARRYKMRPRAAWRHAHGWSLKQAAQRITACATQAGVDPDGNTVAMTGPHLCEVEAWPGYGAKPSGRRPTPYLLSLLAVAYDCAIADLLDLADYEHMRPADHLVLGKATNPAEQGGGLTASGVQARPRPVAQIAAPLSRATVTGSPLQVAAVPALLGRNAVTDAAGVFAPGLAPLARVLLSAPQADGVVHGHLADQVMNIWRLRQAARYRQLASELPAVLAKARGYEAAGVTEDPRLASVLTHLYNGASSLAKALGSLELAGIAADRAVRTAQSTSDPLLTGAAAYRLANVLLSAGQLDSAKSLAAGAADQLRPVLTATRSHTAMWGALLATSALAAAKAHAVAEARELLGASKVAADLLTTEQADLFSIFGPANWLIHAVNIAADLGDGADAVRRAEQIPAGKLPVLLAERRTFLLLGRARGHALCGDSASAALVLLDAEHAAPEEVRHNPGARSLAACLLAASPMRNDPLRELAARMSNPTGLPALGALR
jgi:hypothetical protein